MQTFILTTIVYSLYSVITTIFVIAALALSTQISRLEEQQLVTLPVTTEA